MPGSLVYSAVAPHSPRMGFEATTPDFLKGVAQGLRELGASLAAARPDVAIVHSTHWVTTFKWYVTAQARHRGVCVAEEAPDLIPGIPYDRPGDPDLAAALAQALEAAGIPCGRSTTEHHRWDYGSLVPLLYIDPGQRLPVVLVGTCVMASQEECLRAGAAMREVAERSGKRVAFIASTAFAHEIVRGPETWPTPDQREADRAMIERLTAGRIAEAKREFPAYSKRVVAEMGGRVLATFLGTLADERAYCGRQFGAYGQSSASGNAAVGLWAA